MQMVYDTNRRDIVPGCERSPSSMPERDRLKSRNEWENCWLMGSHVRNRHLGSRPSDEPLKDIGVKKLHAMVCDIDVNPASPRRLQTVAPSATGLPYLA